MVREQLALAHLPSRRRNVQEVLERHGVGDPSRRWDALSATTRVAILLDLATCRRGTQVVVLCNPDRHGGDAGGWYAAALATAAEVFTVVVLCTAESATHVGAPHPVPAGNAMEVAR